MANKGMVTVVFDIETRVFILTELRKRMGMACSDSLRINEYRAGPSHVGLTVCMHGIQRVDRCIGYIIAASGAYICIITCD